MLCSFCGRDFVEKDSQLNEDKILTMGTVNLSSHLRCCYHCALQTTDNEFNHRV